MRHVILSVFAVCLIPCIYAELLQTDISPRKQKRLRNKARRKLNRDPLLSLALPVSEFAPVHTDLLNPGFVDPLLGQGPLDTLLHDHQGNLPAGIGSRNPIHGDILNPGFVDPLFGQGSLDTLLHDHQGILPAGIGSRNPIHGDILNPGLVDPLFGQGPLDTLLHDHQGILPAGIGSRAQIHGDLLNSGLVDPLFGQGPLDTLLHDHQGILPAGIGSRRPLLDPATRGLINRNKAIGTKEALRQNRQIKKGLRKARRQSRKEKKARKQIRKQQKRMRQGIAVGGPLDILSVQAPILPLHQAHPIAENILINNALNTNKNIAKQKRKAMKKAKKQRKRLQKAAKQAAIIGGALDVIPVPEPILPFQPDHHLAEKILINDALNNKQNIVDTILVNNALNKEHILATAGLHDSHLHGGDTLLQITDANHPPPHHPPVQQKQNKLHSLVKGVLLGGIGAMLLGK
ncbi:uncharacterized protein LOC110461047 [Mizuhopecten yessoensis]|uniref:uncharacterized protein LOC110461047 n=1 Tax=Mizuhopecten yessoensis TaxID=6573 RepID=UPI000B45C3EA|nr:uncharacterized protein LOC110461047 [Mizuhopecten yessoensis]